MLRYIALAWNSASADEDALAANLKRRLETQLADWTRSLDVPGLRVFHVGATGGAARVYTLDNDGGVIFGKLFPRDKTAGLADPSPQLSQAESDALRQSRGKHLIERYWGRYVAILNNQKTRRSSVLRDPTGAVPCFVTRYNGIHVLCSHVDDCARLGLVDASIDWEHVAAYLWFDHLVTSRTGLDKVRQLLAGERVEIGPDDTAYEFCWRPDRFCRRPFAEDRQQAGQELRRVIEWCVSAWASCFDSILHQLSGGLDSSVVLACLSRASTSPKVICENHLTRNAESDERIFAREAASAAGVRLVEAMIPSIDRPLDQMFESALVATPAYGVFIPESQSAKERLVEAHGVEAVFSGQGGDHFFQRSKNPHIAAEYARRHGIRGEIFRVISDTSRFTNRPIWSVLAAAVLFGLCRKSVSPYDIVQPPALVSRNVRGALDDKWIRHPWVDFAQDLPGSKQQQIFHVVDSQVFHHVPDHYADIVHPLISQPIIELCLRIPSYIMTYGGIDRALVRDAFCGSVPASILARTTKGATTGYFISLLIKNIGVMREYLLDGLLAGEGALDKHKAEAALSESALIRDRTLMFPALCAFRAELWARSWAGDGNQNLGLG